MLHKKCLQELHVENFTINWDEMGDFVIHCPVFAIFLKKLCLQGGLMKGKCSKLMFSKKENPENFAHTLP